MKRSTGFGWFMLLAGVLAVLGVILSPAPEPTGPTPEELAAVRQETTGGAQTLEDILRRQEGLPVDDSFRREAIGGDAVNVPGIDTLGGASDPELWRALRYNELNDPTVTTRSDVGAVMVQDGGMWWLTFREGPLAHYGGLFLLATLGALVLFYLFRGRIRIDGGKAGTTVTRFAFIERMAHWMLAGSFILLGITGLLTLFGRLYIAPVFGREANAVLLTYSKFIHNNISWAFMLALLMVFVMWVWHNIPDKTDIVWFKQAGGIIGDAHPPAKKFNGGQKIIFWSVIVLGASISFSGLSLLFPFELPLFAKTFGILNDMGVPGWIGMAEFPTSLTPQEEMQYAQLWHAIVAFGLMAVILGHIYIGTLGMEGAYDAMGSGQVDEAWAHQHHSIWYDKLREKGEATAPHAAKAPAE